MKTTTTFGLYWVLCMLGIHLGSCTAEPEKQNLPEEPGLVWVDSALDRSVLSYLCMLSTHPGMTRYPRTYEDDELKTVSSSDWTSGFFPGILWYLYEYSGDDRLYIEAEKFSAGLFKEKNNTGTHDLGFILFCSLGNAYRITGDALYKEVLLEGAGSLASRYNPKVGAIKSWDWGKENWAFPVIIDNMMNLEYLYWASHATGDSSFYKIAISHADQTLEHHYREDFSTWHVVDYDPLTGDPVNKLTHQGYSDGSQWARGQAWGLYGFVMCYRETGEERFLRQAKKIADYWIHHPAIPGDLVPYWDFDDPEIPNAPRDASAAAIVAAALIELSRLADDRSYLDYAHKVLKSLASEEYMASLQQNGGFVLLHSTGNKPKDSEVDTPLIYADYYFIEALLRYKALSAG